MVSFLPLPAAPMPPCASQTSAHCVSPRASTKAGIACALAPPSASPMADPAWWVRTSAPCEACNLPCLWTRALGRIVRCSSNPISMPAIADRCMTTLASAGRDTMCSGAVRACKACCCVAAEARVAASITLALLAISSLAASPCDVTMSTVLWDGLKRATGVSAVSPAIADLDVGELSNCESKGAERTPALVLAFRSSSTILPEAPRLLAVAGIMSEDGRLATGQRAAIKSTSTLGLDRAPGVLIATPLQSRRGSSGPLSRASASADEDDGPPTRLSATIEAGPVARVWMPRRVASLSSCTTSGPSAVMPSATLHMCSAKWAGWPAGTPSSVHTRASVCANDNRRACTEGGTGLTGSSATPALML
mmetsp:Transcript_10355/g.31841  ORF Transcript_10355/g.31841 Transcript_10355/m.31841 type:complete len:365 (-) Transcript_10355:394-1488(-)|eukprot:scaffold29834_cov31-Tisochrysis_lutea.AAC.2